MSFCGRVYSLLLFIFHKNHMGFSKNWCISPLKQCVYGCGYSILIHDTYIRAFVLSSVIIFLLFSVLCVYIFVCFAFLTFNFKKLYLFSTFLINENEISYQWLFSHLHIAHLIDWTKNLFLFSFYSHHHHQNNPNGQFNKYGNT